MNLLFGAMYMLFLLGSLLVSFFIVFHLAKYSINRGFARLTIVFFLVGTTILLVSNVLLFFSLPQDTASSFFPNTLNSSPF